MSLLVGTGFECHERNTWFVQVQWSYGSLVFKSNNKDLVSSHSSLVFEGTCDYSNLTLLNLIIRFDSESFYLRVASSARILTEN